MRARSVVPVLIAGAIVVAVSSAGGQEPPSPPAAGELRTGQPSGYAGDFSDLTNAIDAFWAETFRAAGFAYASPVVVTVDRFMTTDCGNTGPTDSPFYCSTDATIYLHDQFLDGAASAIGDFAPIAVLAHEWGHHAQSLAYVPNPGSKSNELQADCLAGVYANDAEGAGLLDPGDVTEGVLMAAAVGDPAWLPQDSPGAHGTNDERISAFMSGYLNGLGDCGLPGFPESGRGPADTNDPPATTVIAYLPARPPLEHADCFRVEDDATLGFEELVDRLGGTDEARQRLSDWGWQASANRTFACDTPPEGAAGWIDVGAHLFADAAAAQEAVDYFAAIRAEGTTLKRGAPPAVGEYAVALSGPASNGQEHTIYASRGALLLRVTGVSPSGLPFFDVRRVARSLLAMPTPAPQPPPTAEATSGASTVPAVLAASSSALVDRMLQTPIPLDLLDFAADPSGPRVVESSATWEGLVAEVETDTGHDPLWREDGVALSTITYAVFASAMHAAQAFALWQQDNQQWFDDDLDVSSPDLGPPAVLRLDPDTPIAVCGALEENVVVFVVFIGGSEVWFDALAATALGNCEGAVAHLRSLA
jgi:hypothetical protein